MRNRITVIESVDGVPVHEEEEVGAVFVEFYQKLFSTNGSTNFLTVEETISERITPEMNDKLCQIPDEEQVRTAIFAIHADKAPGADGLSASFYQSFWSLLGPDIFQEIQTFFTSGSMNRKINKTHVCLIPKNTAPKSAAEYRPIALCTFRYKIIAKILTRHLQSILPDIISKHKELSRTTC